MRCGRCGNENAESNRFCGMCGAILSAPAQSPTPAKPSATPANSSAADSAPQRGPLASTQVRERTPAASAPVHSTPERAARTSPPATNPASSVSIRTPARSSYDEPSGAGISGPSFLGLNKPANATSGFGQNHVSSHDDDLDSSDGVDYLLEDDEEPKSGWGKFVVILLALALAAGFGYLRWKQGGFDWLLAGNKKPETTQTGDSAQNNGDNNAPAQPANSPSVNTAVAGGASAAPSGTAAPASSDAAPANRGAPPPAAAPNPSDAPPPAAAQSASPQNSSSGSASASGSASSSGSALPAGPASSDASQSAPNAAQTNSSGAQKQAQPDSQDSGSASENDSANDEPAPKAAPPAPIHRATPKPSPSRPLDSVAEAQRYIYGRGVSRDCDRGVHMLKSAAAQSNAQAMISLGSLYSTGTCAPRDLPTAYRWFAVALHKQPDNQALQNDLQSLWGQMTQPERQLAIKLSQ